MRVEPIKLSSAKETESLCQGTRAGDWVFVSGRLGLNRDSPETRRRDFNTQAEQAFESIGRVLETAGSSLSDIVKLTAYLVNPVHFQNYDEVLARIFPDNPPASTAVVASSLSIPEALVLIEAYAYLGNDAQLLTLPEMQKDVPFSQGARGGNTILVSGQTAFSQRHVAELVADFSGQLKTVFRNIETVLQASGATFQDLVKINYFITNPLYYGDLANIRDQTFKKDPPGDDVVTIRALADPQCLVEAEAIALVPSSKAEFVNLPDGPPPFNFSNVVVADGFAYVSGQTAINKQRNMKGAGDFSDQFNNALRGVESSLESVSCSFDNVAKISYFISHAGYFDQATEIINRMSGKHSFASTGIAVDSIGGFAEGMCEIDAIAALP